MSGCFGRVRLRRVALAVLAGIGFFALATAAIEAQTTPSREWVWQGGDTTVAHAPVFGKQGKAAAGNTPGSRYAAATWTDASGNFWLFGGFGYTWNGNFSALNDLWMYSTTTGQWTWVNGGNQFSPNGVYGTINMPDPGNFPSIRAEAAAWTDKSGNFWMFGGAGNDSAGNSALLNDLWEFSPSMGEWTWVGGPNTTTCTTAHASTICLNPGVYGMQGTADSGNIPGGREFPSFWTDASSNLWLFGGESIGTDASTEFLNDLWEYSPGSGNWTWIDGSATPNASGSEGNLGTPGSGIIPYPTSGSADWVDAGGNFWMFGGFGMTNQISDLLWEFSPASTEWTWWGPPQIPPTFPVGAQYPSGWTDSNGDLWLFGGSTVDGVYCGEGCISPWQDYSNSLWQYDASTNAWTKVSGADPLKCTQTGPSLNCTYLPGNYGTFGAPGGRYSSASWTDTNGNFWIYGGYGIDATGTVGPLSDFWMSAPPAPAPTFSEPAGGYTGVQSITISDTVSGATIYYTTDGSKPTSSSNLYNGSVTLNQAIVQLQAIAIAPGFGPSPIASATYDITLPSAAPPQFSPVAGTYKSPQTVTITSSTPGAIIYYAINSSPTSASAVYTGPIAVSQSETIEAFAIAPGYSNSQEASASYQISATTALLAVSVTQSPDAFQMSCDVTASAIAGKPGPTGTVHFTDLTTGKLLGTQALNQAKSQPATQTLTSLVGADPAALAQGDFNNDGIADLAVANLLDGTVSILLGNGDGTFQPQVVYPVGTNPQALAVGKFNNDANLDLAVLNRGSNDISILLGNGDGTFTPEPSSMPTGQDNSAPQILAGDFNNDGKLDLALVGNNDSNPGVVSIFLGNGDGTFQDAKITALSSAVTAAVAGKFAGSGNLDLVIVNYNSSSQLSLLAGNGDGTFAIQSIAAGAQLSGVSQIATGDFNSDGIPDLVVAGSEFVAVLLGNGDGTYQYSPALVFTTQASAAQGILVGKFNGDTHDDVAIAYAGDQTIDVFSGAGNGTIKQTGLYVVDNAVMGLVGGSFGGNQNPTEFVTANFGTNNNTVTLVVPTVQEVASVSPQFFTVPPDALAQHNFQCSYSGDANYGASTSNTVAEVYFPADPPVFSLLVGTYAGSQQVQITDTSYEATIYYTTDGSDPTTSSTVYTGPITLTTTTKLKAIAGGGYLSSLISEAVYTITDAPMFAASGSGTASTKVTIKDATPGSKIYYTVDGSTPSIHSAVYSGAITLTKATTIKAFAATAGQINSPMVMQTFNVTTPSVPDIVWPAPRAIAYGTALGAPELDASTGTAGTFKYSPGTGAMLAAGTHQLTVTFTPADRVHFAIATKTVTLDVSKKALIVAAPKLDKVYGAEMPKIGYKITGLVSGDVLGKAVTGAPVVSTKATAKSAVGNYPIKVTLGTLRATNYSFQLLQGDVKITKAPLHVRANSLTMKQGAQVPTLTYVIAPFVNGDRLKTATSGTPKLATSVTSNSKPGTYPITVSAGTLKAENYAITYINGRMTVTP